MTERWNHAWKFRLKGENNMRHVAFGSLEKYFQELYNRGDLKDNQIMDLGITDIYIGDA